MEAHGEDLRAEVQDRQDGEALVEAIKRDYRTAALSDADRAMLGFATKLTQSPDTMAQSDVQALRAQGFDDQALFTVVQITGLFAYYNRLADGLGIDDEPEW